MDKRPSAMAEDNNRQAEEINAATCRTRTPPFLEGNVSLWFLQLTSFFTSERLTSQNTRFHCAVGALPQSALIHVAGIIQNPGNEPYTRLVNTLTRIYGESTSARLQRVLTETSPTDERPSAILSRLTYEIGDTTPSAIIKSLWIRRLPHETQLALAASTNQDLERLAEIADRLSDIASSPRQVDAVTSQITLQSLQDQIRQLSDRLNNNRRDRSASTDRSRTRSTSGSRRGQTPPPECRFHRRWGNKARNCERPCRFNQGN